MRKTIAWLIAMLSLFTFLGSAAAQAQVLSPNLVEVKQYYNPSLKTFVLSSDKVEQAIVERGEKGDWRLVSSFFAYPGDSDIGESVCRFFYAVIGMASHFHSANPAECAKLKTTPSWIFESDSIFKIDIPTASVCSSGQPLYRLWNRKSNHVLVPDLAAATLMEEKWNALFEGVVMCTPKHGIPFKWDFGSVPPPPPPPPPPGPPGDSAGKVDFYMTADGAVLTIVPTLIDGKVVALGADGQGFKLDPATITSGCWRGNTDGWEGDTKACAPIKDGKVLIPGLCNRDRGMPTLRAGVKDYYLDFSNSVIRWDLAGLQAKIVDGSFVEFAQTGKFEKPRVLVKDGNLVLAFNRDCETGFGLNGVPTDFSGELFKFTFVSTTGKDVDAFRNWDDVNKAVTVTFEKGKIKCQDTGSVKVFLPKRVSADGKTVEEWMPDPAGWLAIGSPPNAPDIIWDFGPGVEAVVKPPFHGFKHNLGC